jgi:hypothetical protein
MTLSVTWFAVALVAVSAAALIIAYMRKPVARQRLRLSTAKFIVDLTPATRARIALTPLLQSPLFWLRMLILALIAAALLLVVKWNPGFSDARLGLRIVVDTTASMRVTGGAANAGPSTSRAAEAVALVTALTRDKAAEATTQNYAFCATILAVDGDAREVPPSGLDASLAPRQRGGDPRRLTSVALAEDSRCPTTHAIVVTDRRKPAIPAAGDRRTVLWWQVGRPAPNAAIEQVTMEADPLIAGPVRVRFTIRQYGAAGPREAVVTGPDGGTMPPAAAGCATSADEFCFEAPAPGRYTIALSGTDAFAGDDRAIVDVPAVKPLAVDWQLPILPPPALRRDGGSDAIIVAPAAGHPDIAGRRAVLVGADWPPRPGPLHLGWFNPDDPLLDGVNLDLLEQAAASRVALPAGFVRTATAADGAGIIVARRATPRAAIIPPPLLRPDTALPLRNASLLLLANALRYVSEDQIPPVMVSWIDSDGHELPGVQFESDTAEDGDRADLTAAIAPVKSSSHDGRPPLWPWLVALAIAALAAERAAALAWRTP